MDSKNLKRLKEWEKKYHEKRFIDLKKYVNDANLDLLKKLGIEIEDKIYTEYEFDILDENLFEYYIDDDILKTASKEELELTKPLEGTGVSREEYNRLVDLFSKIATDYNI